MALTSTYKKRTYDIGKQLGKGGVATVYIATCKEDGKQYAFKHFKPVPNDLQLTTIHANIKKNIINLVEKPLVDSNGDPLDCFVPPIDYFDNVKGGFGYIMPLIDTKKYLSLIGTWSRGAEGRPDAKAMCEICKKVAVFFEKIHSRGYCYKDINEGNIYIDPKGDIRIIDCDNIAIDGRKTILGTPGYIAPEVYKTATPNEISDRFSMATFFYRLMVGGYPFEGKKTARYLIDNDMDMTNPKVTMKFFCEEPLFAFDEKDDSNSIKNVKDNKISDNAKKQWNAQANFWDILPDEIKKLFQKTFSECLKGDAKDRRASDKMWINTFDAILKNGIELCSCKRYNYSNNVKCVFCDKKIVVDKSKKQANKQQPDTSNQSSRKITFDPVTPVNPSPVVAPQNTVSYTRVKFAVKTEDVKCNVTAKEFDGSKVCPRAFKSGTCVLTVDFDNVRKVMKCKNTSGHVWRVTYPNKSSCIVANGRTIVLPVDTIITVGEKDDGSYLMKLKVMEFI